MSIFNLWKTIIPALLILMLTSCLDTTSIEDWDLSDQEYDLAVPLVNSKITMSRLAGLVKGNTTIKFDENGRATVAYNGEVLRKNSAAIFPAYPGVIPLLIYDTLSYVEILPITKSNIKKAIFKDTKTNFVFHSNLPQDLLVTIMIPEMSKNGQTFSKTFTVKYNNTLPVVYQTEDISVDGWEIETNRNIVTIRYSALTPDGKKVKLDKAYMNYDLIKFSYLEGYLGYHIFPIDGSIIDISLFDSWKSGTFDFENPKITLSIENAFGLPVRSKVNKLSLTSITGNTVNLESPFVEEGINFEYPSLNEVGQIKTTNFSFDKTNSNIRELFNEKTKTVSYDISALINTDRDTNTIGFITDQSYFVVRVAAEVPLNGSVNQLVVADTIDINLPEVEHVLQAELKTILNNDFPANVRVQAYFLDDENKVLDVLFEGDGIDILPAPLGSNNQTVSSTEKIAFISFDKQRYEIVRKATKLAISGYLNTTDSEQNRSLWIYDRYGIGVKIGAKLKVKKE